MKECTSGLYHICRRTCLKEIGDCSDSGGDCSHGGVQDDLILTLFRFSLGVTRMDKIRNEYIRGTAQIGRLGEKIREARLRWFGHVLRKDAGYIGKA